MGRVAYLFEKSCFVPEGLARFGEELQLLSPGSPRAQHVRSYLNVALRQGLSVCCVVSGARFEATWVEALTRGGSVSWKSLHSLIEAALFGPDNRDEAIKEAGFPRSASADLDELDLELDLEELIRQGTKALAALLDLADVALEHRCYEIDQNHFQYNLCHAFNGATKLLANLFDSEWSADWPAELTRRGRSALEEVLARIEESGEAWKLNREDLAPLDEAWLAEIDPEKTPEAAMAAERLRRAGVTRKNRLARDLVIPKRYREISIEGLLVDRVPGHDVCLAYARNPKGTLVIHGELASGMYEIQWAIARHWFVDELRFVRAVDWHEIVENNLMAQNQELWDCPWLIITRLRPAWLSGGVQADPCYAERMLEHRLTASLPTVITIERCGLDEVNLRSRTIQLLKASKNVVLSRLSESDLEAGEMFR